MRSGEHVNVHCGTVRSSASWRKEIAQWLVGKLASKVDGSAGEHHNHIGPKPIGILTVQARNFFRESLNRNFRIARKDNSHRCIRDRNILRYARDRGFSQHLSVRDFDVGTAQLLQVKIFVDINHTREAVCRDTLNDA